MINIYTWNDGTELYHHGILGQKWGVRRYQNPDGSLTAAGVKRYSKTFNENEKLEIKKNSYLKKAEKYERKTPSFYLTDFGKYKQQKFSGKAAAARGKASSIQKKIDKNNSKEYMKIGKSYLESIDAFTRKISTLKSFNEIEDDELKELVQMEYNELTRDIKRR